MEPLNCFILLELNCSETDLATIEAAIHKKRMEWSNRATLGPNPLEAKRNLELIRDIELVMKDPVKRAEEAVRCGEIREKAEEIALEEVEPYLAVMEAKGYVLEAELADLVTEFQGWLKEDQIRAARESSHPSGASPGRAAPAHDRPLADEEDRRGPQGSRQERPL